MRISERKRQLREVANNPGALAERQVLRAAAQAQPAARKTSVRPKTETTGARAKATATPSPKARARKQRGSGFYTGFGVFGLCFALIFGFTTVNTYRSDSDKYPAKIKAYQSAQVAYAKQLTQYHAVQVTYTKELAAYKTAVAKHTTPLPVKPKAPPSAPPKPKVLQSAAPTKPELSASSFMLPVLYALLSIAYLYLGRRAKMQNAAAGAATPAKRPAARG